MTSKNDYRPYISISKSFPIWFSKQKENLPDDQDDGGQSERERAAKEALAALRRGRQQSLVDKVIEQSKAGPQSKKMTEAQKASEDRLRDKIKENADKYNKDDYTTKKHPLDGQKFSSYDAAYRAMMTLGDDTRQRGYIDTNVAGKTATMTPMTVFDHPQHGRFYLSGRRPDDPNPSKTYDITHVPKSKISGDLNNLDPEEQQILRSKHRVIKWPEDSPEKRGAKVKGKNPDDNGKKTHWSRMPQETTESEEPTGGTSDRLKSKRPEQKDLQTQAESEAANLRPFTAPEPETPPPVEPETSTSTSQTPGLNIGSTPIEGTTPPSRSFADLYNRAKTFVLTRKNVRTSNLEDLLNISEDEARKIINELSREGVLLIGHRGEPHTVLNTQTSRRKRPQQNAETGDAPRLNPSEKSEFLTDPNATFSSTSTEKTTDPASQKPQSLYNRAKAFALTQSHLTISTLANQLKIPLDQADSLIEELANKNVLRTVRGKPHIVLNPETGYPNKPNQKLITSPEDIINPTRPYQLEQTSGRDPKRQEILPEQDTRNVRYGSELYGGAKSKTEKTQAESEAANLRPFTAPAAPTPVETVEPTTRVTTTPTTGKTTAPKTGKTTAPKTGGTRTPSDKAGPRLDNLSRDQAIPDWAQGGTVHAVPSDQKPAKPTTSPTTGVTTTPTTGVTTTPTTGGTMTPKAGKTKASKTGKTAASKTGKTAVPKTGKTTASKTGKTKASSPSTTNQIKPDFGEDFSSSNKPSSLGHPSEFGDAKIPINYRPPPPRSSLLTRLKNLVQNEPQKTVGTQVQDDLRRAGAAASTPVETEQYSRTKPLNSRQDVYQAIAEELNNPELTAGEDENTEYMENFHDRRGPTHPPRDKNGVPLPGYTYDKKTGLWIAPSQLGSKVSSNKKFEGQRNTQGVPKDMFRDKKPGSLMDDPALDASTPSGRIRQKFKEVAAPGELGKKGVRERQYVGVKTFDIPWRSPEFHDFMAKYHGDKFDKLWYLAEIVTPISSTDIQRRYKYMMGHELAMDHHIRRAREDREKGKGLFQGLFSNKMEKQDVEDSILTSAKDTKQPGALVPYKKPGALVPYKKPGALAPYKKPFEKSDFDLKLRKMFGLKSDINSRKRSI